MTAVPKLTEVKTPKLVGVGSKPEKRDNKAQVLPEPKGWRILLAIPEAEEKTEGGIFKADITRDIESTSTVLGLVLEMGDQCYQDPERFGPDTKPWCKKGDFVLIGAYKGVRFRIHGKEFRIINDDTVQATVGDPRGYTRA